MKIIKLNHLITLLLSAMFILPVTAQEDDTAIKEPSRIKQYGEFFIGLGSWQNVGLASGDTYSTGGFHLIPCGIDYTILFPRLPFGIGLVCYKNYAFLEIEDEGSLNFVRRPSYCFSPKISWNKFFNEHHSIHFSASAGPAWEGYKEDDSNRGNAWKYDCCLAGMITASYSYLINGRSGVGLRASFLSYGGIKGANSPNSLQNSISNGLNYVMYAPW